MKQIVHEEHEKDLLSKKEILSIVDNKLNRISDDIEQRVTSVFKNTIRYMSDDINNLNTKINRLDPKQVNTISENKDISEFTELNIKLNNLENKIEELFIKQNNIINVNQETNIKQEKNVFQNVVNVLQYNEHDIIQQENIKTFNQILEDIAEANNIKEQTNNDIEYDEKIEKFISDVKERLTTSIVTYKKSASKYGKYSHYIQLLILLISSASIIVQGIGNETYWMNSYNFVVHGVTTFLTGFYSMYKFSKKESIMKQKISGTSQLILFINAQLKLSKNERMKNDELIKNIIKQQNKLMSINAIEDNELLDSLLL
jgi:hypothetical protein